MASNLDKSKTRAAGMANATKGRKTGFKSRIEVLNEERAKQAKAEIAEAMTPKMTDDEYAKAQSDLLEDVPEEFKGTLSYMAYERGHSSGWEECINILRELVSDLAEPIKKFGERMRAGK